MLRLYLYNCVCVCVDGAPQLLAIQESLQLLGRQVDVSSLLALYLNEAIRADVEAAVTKLEADGLT